MSIQSMRAEMLTTFFNYFNLTNPPLYNLHANQFAGAGKTTLAAEALKKADSFFIYLANNHKIASEQILKHKAFGDLIQIESRTRLCANEEYVKLSNYGINIKLFCPDCPYRWGGCEYFDRIREIHDEPQSWVGVHHHLGGLVNSYVKDNSGVDVVVIDENFINAIYKQTTIQRQSLLNSTALLTQMRDCKERTLLMETLGEFTLSLQSGVINYDSFIPRLRTYYRTRRDTDMDAFCENYEANLASLYFNKQKIFHNIITPLGEAIIDCRNRQPDYIKNVFNVQRGEKRSVIDISRYDLEAINLPCKVMILDATTPTSFYGKIFDRKVVGIEKDINLNSTIYQLEHYKYVMRTLDKSPKTFRRLSNIVDLVARKHAPDKVLVLARKKYCDKIKEIGEQILVDHYPLVGSNDYEGVNVCIIFGTPEPRREVLDRMSLLLECDKSELLYILRETNIIQGVHRLRLSLKPETPTYVYLLTNLKLPFRNVKRISLSKLEQLLKGEEKIATEETEDRIRESVTQTLETKGELPISMLLDEVSGNRAVVSEIVRRMEKDGILKMDTRRSGVRGRPIKYIQLA